LSERGREVAAFHHKPQQSDELRKLSARPVAGSLLELDEVGLVELMSGSDAVVFTAGAGVSGEPDRRLLTSASILTSTPQEVANDDLRR
jgi:hypothetical protein